MPKRADLGSVATTSMEILAADSNSDTSPVWNNNIFNKIKSFNRQQRDANRNSVIFDRPFLLKTYAVGDLITSF